jgi:hypothetical protein
LDSQRKRSKEVLCIEENEQGQNFDEKISRFDHERKSNFGPTEPQIYHKQKVLFLGQELSLFANGPGHWR